MEIEKLKKGNHKIIIGGLIAFCLIAVTITYLGTRAKYQNTEIIPLVNGVVNYKAYDFKVMAMYQQKDDSDCTEDSCYNTITIMPETGYAINEVKSYCTVDNINHSQAVLKTINGIHSLSKISKSDKCYIYFDKKTPNNVTELILSLKIKSGSPNFSKIATEDETKDNNGIYKITDSMYGADTESYYWRGAVTNNYIKFGNFCWRIIRINGDGSIRMIYDGTSCHANGTVTEDSLAVLEQKYNIDGKDASHVGWTYNIENQRVLSGTDSNAKIQLENWYENQSGFTSTQKNKITDGKFCNDRNIASSWYTWGTTADYFNYAAYNRVNDITPTLECNSGDIYTLKVGLITADEIILAGGKKEYNNAFYLYNGHNYWTMTPNSWEKNSGGAWAFYNHCGYLNSGGVGNAFGLRPVINLKANVTFSSGTGTLFDPYIVA